MGAPGTCVVHFNSWLKDGAMSNARPNLLFIVSETPKKHVQRDMEDGATIFTIDRQSPGYNTAFYDMHWDRDVMMLSPCVFKDLRGVSDFIRGYLGLLLVLRFGSQKADIYIFGCHQALSHHMAKAIMYH